MQLNSLNALLAATAASPTPTATAPTGTPSAPPQGPTSLFASPLVLFVLMIVMLYFIMIRPQSQQRKRQAQLLASLKSGDKVVTSSGIVGIVITVKDKTVSLRSADAKMEMTKSSVTEILERSGESSAS